MAKQGVYYHVGSHACKAKRSPLTDGPAAGRHSAPRAQHDGGDVHGKWLSAEETIDAEQGSSLNKIVEEPVAKVKEVLDRKPKTKEDEDKLREEIDKLEEQEFKITER